MWSFAEIRILNLLSIQERCINKMREKKPFVLRIDTEIMKALEKWAADDFRSVNGQIEWILSNTLKKSGRLKKQLEKK